MAKIVGIDFGAQMSGNTVIAHIIDEKIEFNQVAKKQNTLGNSNPILYG